MKTYAKPDHVQASSQLDGLAARMERLASQPNRAEHHLKTASEEILQEALMVIARNMPDNPKQAIARMLNAYDRI